MDSEAAASQIVVCTSPAAFLQRVADAFRFGHHYVAGTVPAAKWPAIAEKFRRRYPTLTRDRKHLSRERRAGRPAVRLLVLEPKGAAAGLIEFVLVASTSVDGDGEAWRIATHDRLRVWTYECVRQTRKGSDKPTWTWRIVPEKYDALRQEIRERIRKKQHGALHEIAESSRKWPGFAPIRKQHRALGYLLLGEWNRAGNKGKPPPVVWPRIGYVRRLKTR
jgi:hypothetical protein